VDACNDALKVRETLHHLCELGLERWIGEEVLDRIEPVPYGEHGAFSDKGSRHRSLMAETSRSGIQSQRRKRRFPVSMVSNSYMQETGRLTEWSRAPSKQLEQRAFLRAFAVHEHLPQQLSSSMTRTSNTGHYLNVCERLPV
jgi:hypothetical protein